MLAVGGRQIDHVLVFGLFQLRQALVVDGTISPVSSSSAPRSGKARMSCSCSSSLPVSMPSWKALRRSCTSSKGRWS